ncbi:GGDEF domain-containing protein [Oribacterium sp. WCC10]|uniref:GGDEF domain-containing protein n=1 Tax=Oribacterium sp. WCC10 TaxID=1855343 RepID=UPI0008E96D16|nr:GGDEF domain-containing protein [Oribacterium sp. WCC10]SFG23811.1 diguanylate cyclase (GGDEF) domain-containing protein [Oribacterium sp. WCC10]
MINELVGDYAFYYIEANAFCVLILLILYIKTTHSVDHQRRQIIFGDTLATAMIYLVTDMFWVLVDSGNIAATPFLLYFTNIMYYCAGTVMSYMVSYFMLMYEGNRRIEEPAVRIATVLPCILNIVAAVTTPLHKQYLYVDGNGALMNGPLYPLLVSVIIVYPIAVGLRAAILSFLKKDYTKKNMYKAIGLFPILPVGLGLVQVYHQRIPFLCFGLTIALLLTYIEFTEDLVSLDPLTKLNNRNELYRYMTGKINSVKSSGAYGLYLMIMDIDSFKKINDTYGHNEGDHALKVLAKVLKKVCGAGANRFVSRFGGDEFIIIVETYDKYEVERICDDIHMLMQRAVAQEQLPFDMDVSIGWARYNKNSDASSITGLIELADNMLYEEKKIKHKVNTDQRINDDLEMVG